MNTCKRWAEVVLMGWVSELVDYIKMNNYYCRHTIK